MFICVFKGTKSAGFIVYVSVPLPIILIFVMVIRGSTLDGADKGIEKYLKGEGNVSDTLQKPDIWSDACGQIFFSIGVCMGVLTSFASYNRKDKPVIVDCHIIPLLNSLVSFFAGFAVFTVIGYLEHIGSPAATGTSSFALAFVAYPTAMINMSGANFWTFILFFTLFSLGLDSAFAYIEAFSTIIYDASFSDPSKKVKNYKRELIASILCVIAFVCSLPFCLNTGLIWMNVVDHYLATYLMQVLGIFQCFAVGWVYDFDEVVRKVGKKSAWFFAIGFWVTLYFSVILAVCTSEKDQWYGLLLFAGLFMITTFIAYKIREPSVSEMNYLSMLKGKAESGDEFTSKWLLMKRNEYVREYKELPDKQELVASLTPETWKDSIAPDSKNETEKSTFKQWIKVVGTSGSEKLLKHCIKLQYQHSEDKSEKLWLKIFDVYLSISLKYIVPLAITFITIRQIRFDFEDPYLGYPGWVQWIGIIIVIIGAIVGIVPVFFCKTFENYEHDPENIFDQVVEGEDKKIKVEHVEASSKTAQPLAENENEVGAVSEAEAQE
jgi:SNF family Na+-dependent transporter